MQAISGWEEAQNSLAKANRQRGHALQDTRPDRTKPLARYSRRIN
jgi:hypothetical protein